MIKARIAPSPTGNLHVGTARTALFNYLFARHHNGKFLLRIEDTDRERSTKEFEKNILEGISWLGITWNEGPMLDGSEKGECGPYRQTERIERGIYKKYLLNLLTNDKAFACFCPQNVEKETEEEPNLHYCPNRNDAYDQNNPKPFVVRYKNDKFSSYYPERQEFIKQLAGTANIFSYSGKDDKNNWVFFQDIIRDKVGFPQWILTDFVISKGINKPLYNFAVVVDDYTMHISHVIRGEDHISNTPKQLLIAEALGWARRDSNGVFQASWEYAHLPLILGDDRSKLSKRHGATSIREYCNEGYLPDALFNFLALLGWNPGNDREIFSQKELIDLFSLERVQKSGAIFDTTKLDWMNSQYIGKKLPGELRMLATPYLGNFLQDQKLKIKDQKYLEQILILEQPRLTKLSELPEKIDYFFRKPEYKKELLRWKSMGDIELKKALTNVQTTIENIPEERWSKEYIELTLLKEAERYHSRGELLWPLRVALSGKKASPGPFEIMAILGKQITLNRIQHAIDLY